MGNVAIWRQVMVQGGGRTPLSCLPPHETCHLRTSSRKATLTGVDVSDCIPVAVASKFSGGPQTIEVHAVWAQPARNCGNQKGRTLVE